MGKSELTTLSTQRLLLRPWKEQDFEPFASLNADPKVMEYFPKALTREESDNLASKLMKDIESRGWGLWAASVPQVTDFIGFVGLNPVPFEVPFTPAVEIGWRVAYEYWGKGYATEAAKAALHFAFETLQLDEVVSFTALENKRSMRVMEKIGLKHNSEDDFYHPNLPENHRLCRHVLYRISRTDWEGDRV